LPISIDLGDGVQLTGETQVGEVNTGTPWVLIYRPGDYDKKPRYQLEAFILTLAATVQLDRPVACRVLGFDYPSFKPLPAIAPDIARQHLNTLVAGFLEGKHMPLCYAPKTSDSMVAALVKDDEAAALDVAESKWNDDAGEGTTPFASLAWRDADPFAPQLDKSWLHWARVVAWPLNNWWNQRTAPVLPITASSANPVGGAPTAARVGIPSSPNA
jgi:exonuclease V gamma subunit